MNVTVDLQNASGLSKLPPKRQFSLWARRTLETLAAQGESAPPGHRLSIRIVNEAESAALNSSYRQKQGPTNILSFPVPPGFAAGGELGDLAICAQVVRREAHEQGKDEQAHWAHLVVHGILHLQGHDHESTDEARVMEALETSILQQLNIGNPYQ